MCEHIYAIKYTWLDWWRWGHKLSAVNYQLNREIYRAWERKRCIGLGR